LGFGNLELEAGLQGGKSSLRAERRGFQSSIS